jgi:hypothetical protein
MASTLKEHYKPWVGSAKRIALIVATISTIFVFTGTACLAGSRAFHRYHGLSLKHWKNGYHHPVRSQKHKRHRFFKNRHIRRHKHKFSSYGYWGGYYDRRDRDDNIQINLILPPDKKEDNSETKIEAREPLPPHIETLTEGNDNPFSSYQTVNSGNTGAHIVEYGAHRK